MQANDDFFFEKRSKSCSADKVQQRAKGFSGLQCSGSLANQCAVLHGSVQCYSVLCYSVKVQFYMAEKKRTLVVGESG